LEPLRPFPGLAFAVLPAPAAPCGNSTVIFSIDGVAGRAGAVPPGVHQARPLRRRAITTSILPDAVQGATQVYDLSPCPSAAKPLGPGHRTLLLFRRRFFFSTPNPTSPRPAHTWGRSIHSSLHPWCEQPRTVSPFPTLPKAPVPGNVRQTPASSWKPRVTSRPRGELCRVRMGFDAKEGGAEERRVVECWRLLVARAPARRGHKPASQGAGAVARSNAVWGQPAGRAAPCGCALKAGAAVGWGGHRCGPRARMSVHRAGGGGVRGRCGACSRDALGRCAAGAAAEGAWVHQVTRKKTACRKVGAGRANEMRGGGGSWVAPQGAASKAKPFARGCTPRGARGARRA
jgi:hypothetical protein